MSDTPPFDLKSLLSGAEGDYDSGPFVPKEGVAYATGSAARLLAPGYRAVGRLLLPNTYAPTHPIDFMKVLITLSEYGFVDPVPSDGPAHVAVLAASEGPIREKLTNLAILNALVWKGGKELEEAASDYARLLKPEVGVRFQNVMRGPPDRWFLARQGILASVPTVLSATEAASSDVPSIVRSVLLVHAVSEDLWEASEQGIRLGGLPVDLSMEVIQNELFHRQRDPLSTIIRTVRMWREYGDRLVRYRPEASPQDLLRTATGLDVVEWIAYGFAIWAFYHGREPHSPMWFEPGLLDKTDSAQWARFLDQTSIDPPSLKLELDATPGHWAFLALQQRPLIFDEGSYLAIDLTYLAERTTLSLYWDVFDYLKAGSGDWGLWTQAWGEIVESYVGDLCKDLAPPIIGGGKALHVEEEIADAFDGRICDFAIDFGDTVCLVEVVSGQVHTRTRIEGDPEQFSRDTERLAIGKARQLDSTAASLLAEPERLLGEGRTAPWIQPIIVNLGTFPVNPISMTVITDALADEGLLKQGAIRPLAILDVEELEFLLGIAESGGGTAPTLLHDWKESPLRNISFRNYALESHKPVRPAAISETVDETFDEMVTVLGHVFDGLDALRGEDDTE